jgi:hypothetical protein
MLSLDDAENATTLILTALRKVSQTF